MVESRRSNSDSRRASVRISAVFLVIFIVSEHYHDKRLKGKHHQHVEQFNQQTTGAVTPASLGLMKPYRKLVAIRSTQNLYMLEKALAETDPDTTSLVVMTAKVTPRGDITTQVLGLDTYDQTLMTSVVTRAEKLEKLKKFISPKLCKSQNNWPFSSITDRAP